MSSISLPPTDDNTGLLQLLTDGWTESNRTLVQNSQWTSDYLARLTSLSLDELTREPTTLRSNQHQIKHDAQQLAYTDYPSFLHVESCRRELGLTLESLDDHFCELLTTAPALQQACEEFTIQANDIAQERAKMTRVLEHQHILMDLLELPQLMDTCVWNGYYSEAMDLAAHVRLLQVRYPLPVVRTIYDRIQASSDLMLIQLISHLRQPIKLAVAMNIIGHLRRMDALDSERELRMVFLRCRHSCMEQRLEKIKKPADEVSIVSSPVSVTTTSTATPTNNQDTFDYLKRYVDVMREQMFEMATHYMSIFSGDETDTILSDYMTHMVMQIQHILSEHLRYIDDTSALASLLTQLQYCGMSLGRVGLDFRHLFVSYFEQAIKPLVLRTMDQATSLLATDTLQEATKDQILPSTWLTTNHLSGGEHSSSSPRSTTPLGKANKHSREQHPFQPPITLVDYPCLAIFTNGILTALNALRLLPAIGLFPLVNQHMNNCLLEVAGAIKQYGDQVARQFADESVFVESFAMAYARYCVPFLQRCLVEGIFGYSVGQENDGGSNTNITKDIELQLAGYLVASTPSKMLPDVQGTDTVVGKVDNKLNDKVDEKVDDNVDNQVDEKVDDKADNKVDDNVDNQVDDKADDKVDEKMNEKVNDKLDEKVDDKLDEKVDDKLDEKVDDKLDDKVDDNTVRDGSGESDSNDSASSEAIDRIPASLGVNHNQISNNDGSNGTSNEELVSEQGISNDATTSNTPPTEDCVAENNQERTTKKDTGNTQLDNDTSTKPL